MPVSDECATRSIIVVPPMYRPSLLRLTHEDVFVGKIGCIKTCGKLASKFVGRECLLM